MATQLKKLGLKVHDIASDGNCLYRAIEHQLRLVGNDEVVTPRYLVASLLFRVESAQTVISDGPEQSVQGGGADYQERRFDLPGKGQGGLGR